MNYKCKDCGRDIEEESGRCDRCMLYELQIGKDYPDEDELKELIKDKIELKGGKK